MQSPKEGRSRKVRRFQSRAPRRALPRARSLPEVHWADDARPPRPRGRSVVEAVLLDPAPVIGLQTRARVNVFEAVLLDDDDREVVRHPDIYKRRRAQVPLAPAARTTPEHLDGEPRGIAVPGEDRINLLGVSIFSTLLVLGVYFLMF